MKTKQNQAPDKLEENHFGFIKSKHVSFWKALEKASHWLRVMLSLFHMNLGPGRTGNLATQKF